MVKSSAQNITSFLIYNNEIKEDNILRSMDIVYEDIEDYQYCITLGNRC